jgi:hypothetical protein
MSITGGPMTDAVIFEKWEGKTIVNLRSVVDAIYDAYVPIATTDDRRERIPNLYPMQSGHARIIAGKVEASEKI